MSYKNNNKKKEKLAATAIFHCHYHCRFRCRWYVVYRRTTKRRRRRRNKVNSNRIINTTTTTPMCITGEDTCLYSSRVVMVRCLHGARTGIQNTYIRLNSLGWIVHRNAIIIIIIIINITPTRSMNDNRIINTTHRRETMTMRVMLLMYNNDTMGITRQGSCLYWSIPLQKTAIFVVVQEQYINLNNDKKTWLVITMMVMMMMTKTQRRRWRKRRGY